MKLLLASLLLLTMSVSFAKDKPLVIAHRGDCIVCPENTIAAIESAAEKKADLIEFDVRQTADGELYVFHDDNLERYGGGKKEQFDQLDTEAVLKIDVGNGEAPPKFSEAVLACLKGGVPPLIERKSGSAAAYLAVLDALDAREKVVVQAFDWEFLTDLKALAPEIKIGALGSKSLKSDRMSKLKALSPQWVGWNQKDLTSENIKALQLAGFKVAVWTLNDLARIRKFVAAGADGIITDRPGEVKDAFSE